MQIDLLEGASPPQRLALSSVKRETFFIGGVGSGKTWTLARRVIREAAENPPQVAGLLVAPTYDMLRNPVISSIEELCAAWGIKFRYNKNEKLITIGGNRKIHVRSAEEPQYLAALTVGWLMMDEAALCSQEAYERASQRIRDPRGTQRALFTTTPEGTRTWVAKRERDGAYVVRSRTQDNPTMTAEYIAHLRDVVYKDDPAGLRQYMEGIATDRAGNIYPQLTTLNIKPFVQRSPVRVCVGWDFNTHNMVTPLFAWDSRSQTLHCIGEVVSKSVSGVTTEEHARKVAQAVLETGLAVQHMNRLINKSDTEPVWAFIDASGSQRRSSATWTDEAAVRAAGFQPRHDASNPLVRDRIQGVRLALSGGRLLFDEARCPNTLRAMREHAYDKNGDPQKKWGPKDFECDHWTDAVGYACYGLMPVKMR